MAVVVILLASCWGNEDAPTAEKAQSSGERYIGYLTWGHEVRSFVDCDGQREAWVINDVGEELVEIYDSLTVEPYQPMFVEVKGEIVDPPTEGFGADFPEAIRISELVRAENEGFGCNRNLQGIAYLASGNEPGWQLEIRMDGMTLSRFGSSAELEFPPADVSSGDGIVTFNTRSSETDLQAVIERKRCVDSMSGARYSFAATVDVDGQQYKGCALQGQ